MSNKPQTKERSNQAGFSLIEAVIAILIITIGLIGTAAALSYSLKFGSISRNMTNSKLIAVSTIEEIDSLRNTRRLDFKQIANVGSVDNTGSANSFSGFSKGFKAISLEPGPDGVSGTDDDLKAAGKDGVYGTADDFSDDSLIRSGYSRQITITDLSDSMKKVEVRVLYFSAGGGVGQLVGVSYINDEVRVTQ